MPNFPFRCPLRPGIAFALCASLLNGAFAADAERVVPEDPDDPPPVQVVPTPPPISPPVTTPVKPTSEAAPGPDEAPPSEPPANVVPAAEPPLTTPPTIGAPAVGTPPVAIPDTPTAPPAGSTPLLSPTQPLTLTEAIRIAQQYHGSVEIAEESVNAAEQRVDQAQAGNRPIVIGSVEYNIRSLQFRNSGGTGIGSGIVTDPGFQPRVTMNWNVFDSGLTSAQVRQARAGVTNNAANLVATRNNLALTVSSFYLAQLQSERLLELRRTQENLAEQQFRRVEARVAEGAAAAVETALPLSEYRNRQVDRIAAENNVRVSATALRNSMGLPVGPPLTLVQPVELTGPIPPLEPMLETARQVRPEVIQAQAQVEIAQQSVRVARIQRNPRLDTQVNLDMTPTASNQWSALGVGAAISMPIWDAGRTRSQEAEAQANLRSTEAQLTQIRKDVAADVEQAYFNLVNARERLEPSSIAVDAARANLEAATERYELSIRGISVVDLIEAQVQFNTASTNAIQALYDVYLAQAQLERAIGQTPVVGR